jgi:hypothetical protein
MTTQLPAPRPSRDAEHWATPVDRLSASGVSGAPVDSVTGKRVAGPLQGFGQLWQKTFTVRLEGTDLTPASVIATWKDRFPMFWPPGQRFYAPLAGIAPGEVALLDIAPVPGAPVKLSTGVMVLYADDESFTFMTPEGHTLSAWITFSAYRDGDVTVAQAQALERPSDPLDELAYMLGGNRMNDRFWRQTLENLARHIGTEAPVVETQSTCIDRRRQWRYASNLRNSATLRTARRTLTAPVRWIIGRG